MHSLKQWFYWIFITRIKEDYYIWKKKSAPELHKHVKKAQFITLETKVELIQRVKDRKTCPNVYRSLNLPPSTVAVHHGKCKYSAQQSMAVNERMGYNRGKLGEGGCYCYRWVISVIVAFIWLMLL